MKIIVASKNPVKINAALIGFQKMFPSEKFEIEGVDVPSNVSAQPLTDSETFQGALNRALNAKQHTSEADFWIGLEGGIEEKSGEMETFAWMVVLDKNGKTGKGRTGTFFLPPAICELIQAGKELGEADDIVFGTTNSKQTTGSVGILTHNAIDRAKFYAPAVMFALIPFVNPTLYPEN